MRMRFWRRPLRAMLAAVREAGFRVEEIAGPDPAPEMAATDATAYAHLSRIAQFLFGLGPISACAGDQGPDLLIRAGLAFVIAGQTWERPRKWGELVPFITLRSPRFLGVLLIAGHPRQIAPRMTRDHRSAQNRERKIRI
jgi:hypothetical protein